MKSPFGLDTVCVELRKQLLPCHQLLNGYIGVRVGELVTASAMPGENGAQAKKDMLGARSGGQGRM